MVDGWDGTRAGDDPLELIATIARQLAGVETLDETLQGIADLGRRHVDGCDASSVSFVRERAVSTPVWSGQLAYEADQAQYRTGQGPCLQSIADHETVTVDDLDAEERWPEWRAAVRELAVRSSMSFRLFIVRDHDDTMGALNIYSTTPHAFDQRARKVGQVLASHAAVALKAAITEAGLEAALSTRDIIGQAKGVLMERELLTPDQAFERLRQLSNDHNLKLREVAERIAETGDFPGQP